MLDEDIVNAFLALHDWTPSGKSIAISLALGRTIQRLAMREQANAQHQK
jgi:hypothetical protein